MTVLVAVSTTETLQEEVRLMVSALRQTTG
jgi:hypothetical protein